MIALLIKFRISTGTERGDRELCDKFKSEFFGQWDKKLGEAAKFIRPDVVREDSFKVK